MNVLDLVNEIGLNPKRVSSTQGGEYKSPCPFCEGRDRFCIWPNQGMAGKYWCRHCDKKGDAIQFCRDFLGLTYLEACQKVNIEPRPRDAFKAYSPFRKRNFVPEIPPPPSATWKAVATAFIERCHDALLANRAALEQLYARGFNQATIKQFCLGWNVRAVFDHRAAWGLPMVVKENGQDRKQWLPKGIVIPAFDGNGLVSRIKIRRNDWHSEDSLPKYVEVCGSVQSPCVYGGINLPIVVVESELDAILIQQFAQNICCCLSLGGVSKKPDIQTHEFLLRAPVILLALDYDEAGKKACSFWLSLYPNLRVWPPRKGKSPGDSFVIHKVDLRGWVQDGLAYRG